MSNWMIQDQQVESMPFESILDSNAMEIPMIDGLEGTISQDFVVPTTAPDSKTHILTVCQKFVMLFLIAEPPKVMSLEFASKVIHGVDMPETMQKSRARRLYDVSNGKKIHIA